MKLHGSICSLILFSTLGLLAGAESLLNVLSDKIVTNVLDNAKEEITGLVKVPMVYDDDKNLIEVILEEVEEEPSLVIADNVKFYLYTRKNPDIYQELLLNDSEVIALSNFNPEKPTYFVIHGWIANESSETCVPVRQAYLKKDDVNVILVDWGEIAYKHYLWASRQVPEVGQQIAKMIDFLKGENKLDLAETTLVGHSLGAHVAGIAGYYVNGTVGNVVGLDPALPMFANAEPGSRISREDASYVQIIHTNGGLTGYLDEIGHVDFYPNGGSLQSGCLADEAQACSHLRAPQFFAESINSEVGFHAKLCNNFLEYISGICNTNFTAVMGGSRLQIAPPGKYYLTTNGESPYAKGMES